MTTNFPGFSLPPPPQIVYRPAHWSLLTGENRGEALITQGLEMGDGCYWKRKINTIQDFPRPQPTHEKAQLTMLEVFTLTLDLEKLEEIKTSANNILGPVSISMTDRLTRRQTILLWTNSIGQWFIAQSDNPPGLLKQLPEVSLYSCILSLCMLLFIQGCQWEVIQKAELHFVVSLCVCRRHSMP